MKINTALQPARIFMLVTLMTPLVANATALEPRQQRWSYSGASGPAYWADLQPQWQRCRTGEEQSPINLVASQEQDDWPALMVAYQVQPLLLQDTGHTLQVNAKTGQLLYTERGTQQLLQLHFHSPSEHYRNGQQYPLEAHFVHVDDLGQLSVLAKLYEIGDDNAALQQILNEANRHGPAQPQALLSLHSVLASREVAAYYRYQGSLTTPPCTEGVNWYIDDSLGQLSVEQEAQFNQRMGNNARPLQPRYQRPLLLIE